MSDKKETVKAPEKPEEKTEPVTPAQGAIVIQAQPVAAPDELPRGATRKWTEGVKYGDQAINLFNTAWRKSQADLEPGDEVDSGGKTFDELLAHGSPLSMHQADQMARNQETLSTRRSMMIKVQDRAKELGITPLVEDLDAHIASAERQMEANKHGH